MVSGLPILAVRSRGLEGCITEGATGYYINPENPSDCSRLIQQLSSKRDYLREMSQNARRKAEDLSWETIFTDMIGQMESLVRRSIFGHSDLTDALR